MKEALFVLAVVFVLFAITAVRYRRQISGAIGFYRELQKMRSQMAPKQQEEIPEAKPDTLVCCQKCRKWVPESGAVKFGRSVFYCSQKCLTAAAGRTV